MGNAEFIWICCQLGAREHYAVPRALYKAGALAELITDVWISPTHSARWLFPSKLRERFHLELAGATVKASNFAAISFEVCNSIAPRGWELIVRRNDWFQDRALGELTRLAQKNPGQKFRLFSFSYTARRLFEFAKSKGWTTVLGQIDPGPQGERIMIRLHEQHPTPLRPWEPAPFRYWQAWQEECRLADRVIVNSSWSRRALMEEGVPEAKIRYVPLGYDAPVGAATFHRKYPTAFTADRPLRVLFLGQVSLLKGVAAILDAMRLRGGEPVEFWFVGPSLMNVPVDALHNKQSRWLGIVPRGEVARYYQQADVFLFPTFSDGFGLTQLEAQAWKLPVIASRFCGEVVRDGINGIILKEVCGKAIAEAIRTFILDPSELTTMSRNAVMLSNFSTEKIGSEFLRAAAS